MWNLKTGRRQNDQDFQKILLLTQKMQEIQTDKLLKILRKFSKLDSYKIHKTNCISI